MRNRKDSKDAQNPETADNEKDQPSQGYYYDDTTGYEIYTPESEADEETEA